jgi:hypothetical protein
MEGLRPHDMMVPRGYRICFEFAKINKKKEWVIGHLDRNYS